MEKYVLSIFPEGTDTELGDDETQRRDTKVSRLKELGHITN